ncbi:MAG: hypothetical protein WCO60_07095 [Verrucomicrobiota bacterium]
MIIPLKRVFVGGGGDAQQRLKSWYSDVRRAWALLLGARQRTSANPNQITMPQLAKAIVTAVVEAVFSFIEDWLKRRGSDREPEKTQRR